MMRDSEHIRMVIDNAMRIPLYKIPCIYLARVVRRVISIMNPHGIESPAIRILHLIALSPITMLLLLMQPISPAFDAYVKAVSYNMGKVIACWKKTLSEL